MNLRLHRALSSRRLALFALIAFFLVALPFLYLGRYDVPSADDYSFGADTHLAYVHHGLSAVLPAAFRLAGTIYQTWQGSYSAVFLMSLQPGIFSEALYALTPWILMLGLFGGLFALCISLMHQVFGLPRHLGVTLASLLGILYLLLVPYPVQSLYWFNGGVYYSFFHGVAMLAIALGIRTAREGGFLRSLGLCLLAAFLGGGNLITVLVLSLTAASVLALLLLEKRRKQAGRLVLPSLVLLAGFLFNVLAPGNAVRQMYMDHTPSAVSAILLSFRSCLEFCLLWTRLPVLGVLLVLGLLFRAELPGSRFSFRFPALVSLWSYCLLSAMFCPSWYASGNEGPGRIQDIIYCSYLLLLALNLFYWMGWILQRRARGASAFQLRLLPMLGALLLCAALLGASAVLRGGINLVSVYTSLRSGQAERYYQQAQERLAVYHDPSVRVVELEPFREHPYLLFCDDQYQDPEDYRNTSVAKYYEKDRVVLRSDPGN